MNDRFSKKKSFIILSLLIIGILLCITNFKWVNTSFLSDYFKGIEVMEDISVFAEELIGTENESIIFRVNDIEPGGILEEVLSDRYIIIDKSESQSHISLEDNYMERSIKVKISGLESMSLEYDSIVRMKGPAIYAGIPKAVGKDFEGDIEDIATDIAITYKYDAKTSTYTAVVNMVLDTVYVHTLYQDDSHYYIDLRKPKDVYDRLIVVDAGHGGNDCGTFPVGMKYVEKDMNLSIMLYLKQMLEEEKSIKVYYTRLIDEKPFLRPRVRLANDLKADFFISIHCNGSEISQPSGTEVLYNEKSKATGFNSKKLAEICFEEITNVVPLRKRGLVVGSDKYIIGNSKVPVALYEIGYMTNPGDLDFLKDDNNKKLVAQGIFNGIMKAFDILEGE